MTIRAIAAKAALLQNGINKDVDTKLWDLTIKELSWIRQEIRTIDGCDMRLCDYTLHLLIIMKRKGYKEKGLHF